MNHQTKSGTTGHQSIQLNGYKRWLYPLPIMMFLLVSTQCPADSFRCGHKLISNGDTRKELRQVCGEPLKQDFVYEEFWLADGLKKIRLERWHYKLDKKRLERVVLIYRDEIVAVRTGSR